MGLVRFPGWRQVVPLSRQPQHEVAKPIRFIAEEYRLRCKVARRCHSVARRGPRARHSGPQDFQMNGTVVVSYEFQRTLRSGLSSDAVPKSLHVVRGATWHTYQPRHEMKQFNPFSKWLLRFTSSQKNVDRVTILLGGTVSVLCIVLAVAFVIYMLLR
jgi:hypothetical protein